MPDIEIERLEPMTQISFGLLPPWTHNACVPSPSPRRRCRGMRGDRGGDQKRGPIYSRKASGRTWIGNRGEASSGGSCQRSVRRLIKWHRVPLFAEVKRVHTENAAQAAPRARGKSVRSHRAPHAQTAGRRQQHGQLSCSAPSTDRRRIAAPSRRTRVPVCAPAARLGARQAGRSGQASEMIRQISRSSHIGPP